MLVRFVLMISLGVLLILRFRSPRICFLPRCVLKTGTFGCFWVEWGTNIFSDKAISRFPKEHAQQITELGDSHTN